MQTTIAELNQKFNSQAIYSFAYDEDMDRRAILRALIDDRFGGSQADFARAIKKSPAQVNQWLTGHRALGDAGARHIELALNLNAGYFDDPSVGTRPVPSGPVELLDYWDQLLPSEKAEMLEKLRLMAARNQEAANHFGRTVRVSERRKREVHFDFPDRRKSSEEQ